MPSALIEAAAIRTVGARVRAPGDGDAHTDRGVVAGISRHAPVALVRFDCGCRAYVPLHRLVLDRTARPAEPAASRAVVRPEDTPGHGRGAPPARPAPASDIDDPGTKGPSGAKASRGADRPSTPPARPPDAAATGSAPRRAPVATAAGPGGGGSGALPPPRRGTPRLVWTPEKIVAALSEDAKATGRTPSADSWQHKTPGRPTTSTVIRRMGSWDAALQAADLPPNLVGYPSHRRNRRR